jgi:chromate reductase, NAD(P)H dehydrogenase (quinone)
MKILCIVGSLRRESYNLRLMQAAQKQLLEGMVTPENLEMADLAPLPMYNEDIQNEEGFPESVVKLRDQAARADGLLIATPEYNYSISGVLKNAIDWASVSPNPPLKRKPVAIMGATPGQFGTVRGQMHLRDILFGAGAEPMYHVELLMANAKEKFNEQGDLTDEDTKKKLQELLKGLQSWVAQYAHKAA